MDGDPLEALLGAQSQDIPTPEFVIGFNAFTVGEEKDGATLVNLTLNEDDYVGTAEDFATVAANLAEVAAEAGADVEVVEDDTSNTDDEYATEAETEADSRKDVEGVSIAL